MENLVKKTAAKQVNKTKNLSKLTKQNKAVLIQLPPKETKKETVKNSVVYLKEGVTGKQVMRSIYDANNEHKVDLGTFSQCLKRAIQFNKFDTVVNNFDVNELTPKNLMPFRSKANEGKEKFSVYEVLMMIKKFYQAK